MPSSLMDGLSERLYQPQPWASGDSWQGTPGSGSVMAVIAECVTSALLESRHKPRGGPVSAFVSHCPAARLRGRRARPEAS